MYDYLKIPFIKMQQTTEIQNKMILFEASKAQISYTSFTRKAWQGKEKGLGTQMTASRLCGPLVSNIQNYSKKLPNGEL